MKKSPDIEKLENALRSSTIVAGGFLGTDSRDLNDIISSDLSELDGLGITITKLVSRMKEITNTAIPALGNWVKIDEKYEAMVEEAKGILTCPWPHSGGFDKRVTFLKNTKTNNIFKWTDLNIHLIEQHNFFEGKGSPYRIEPKELVESIF
ncbi:MAG: hypothetical protein A2Y12_13800 [Planctomycetes bacterium GWF2_42_9]|nr:MAG: hypothetical protein A2Y12_13800 [Planctomycetes bacterium GWF2_42_9]HAL45586.1 hypothetical protein [Phycisphaerales bacterium]